MLNGQSNINDLKKNGVRIWNEWADDNGELGEGAGMKNAGGLQETWKTIEALLALKAEALQTMITAMIKSHKKEQLRIHMEGGVTTATRNKSAMTSSGYK